MMTLDHSFRKNPTLLSSSSWTVVYSLLGMRVGSCGGSSLPRKHGSRLDALVSVQMRLPSFRLWTCSTLVAVCFAQNQYDPSCISFCATHLPSTSRNVIEGAPLQSKPPCPGWLYHRHSWSRVDLHQDWWCPWSAAASVGGRSKSGRILEDSEDAQYQVARAHPPTHPNISSSGCWRRPLFFVVSPSECER